MDYAVGELPIEASIAGAAERFVRDQQVDVDPSWSRTIVEPEDRSDGFVGAVWRDPSGLVRLLVKVSPEGDEWYGSYFEQCAD